MTAQNIFKPGERIAIPTLPLLKIEGGVAYIDEDSVYQLAPNAAQDTECG
jgi:hypothetical protein